MLNVTLEEMKNMLASPEKGDVLIKFVPNQYYSSIFIIEESYKFFDTFIGGEGVAVYFGGEKTEVIVDELYMHFFSLESSTPNLYLFRGNNVYVYTALKGSGL